MTSLEKRVERLEAIQEIRDLDARYCRALDDGDWDTLVSLFTDDGQFVGLGRAAGHTALRRFFAGQAAQGLSAFWHHVSNLEVTLDSSERARASSLLWQPCVQDGIPHIAAGRYTDTLERIDGAWRYRARHVTFDYFVPLAGGWDHGKFTVHAAADTYQTLDVDIAALADHSPVELHHRVDGPPGAPVLVLGPSLGTDLHLFDAQVDALADDYRIIRYDLPGHGDSPLTDGPYTVRGLARDVIALADRLGVERFHYAGVSLGGAIGQQLALDHPGRLHTLAVIASAARFAEPSSWPRRAAVVRARGTREMLASRPGTWFTHDFVRTDNREATRLVRMLSSTRSEGYAGCCEAIATFDVRRDLGDITVPTLAIAGADDPATPPEMLKAIANGVQNGRYVVIDNAAHPSERRTAHACQPRSRRAPDAA